MGVLQFSGGSHLVLTFSLYLISERADLRTEGPDLRLTPCLPSSGFMTANFESETVVPVSVVIGNS